MGAFARPSTTAFVRKSKEKCKVCSIIVFKSPQIFSCHYSFHICVNGVIPHIKAFEWKRWQFDFTLAYVLNERERRAWGVTETLFIWMNLKSNIIFLFKTKTKARVHLCDHQMWNKKVAYIHQLTLLIILGVSVKSNWNPVGNYDVFVVSEVCLCLS